MQDMSFNLIKMFSFSPNITFLNFAGAMILDCILSTHYWHRWLIFSKARPRIHYSTYTQKEIYIKEKYTEAVNLNLQLYNKFY